MRRAGLVRRLCSREVCALVESPDIVVAGAFPVGEQLTMWLDRDRAAAKMARFSA